MRALTHSARAHSLGGALLLVAAVLVATACQPAGERGAMQETAVDTAAARAAIDSVRTVFEEAYTAGEIERVAPLLAPDVLVSAPGEPPIRGRDSVVAHEQRTWPEGATSTLTPIETRVLSDEWAYEIGTSAVTVTPEGAEEARTMESTYLVILRNTGEGWRVYREVLSPDHPMEGGM